MRRNCCVENSTQNTYCVVFFRRNTKNQNLLKIKIVRRKNDANLKLRRFFDVKICVEQSTQINKDAIICVEKSTQINKDANKLRRKIDAKNKLNFTKRHDNSATFCVENYFIRRNMLHRFILDANISTQFTGFLVVHLITFYVNFTQFRHTPL